MHDEESVFRISTDPGRETAATRIVDDQAYDVGALLVAQLLHVREGTIPINHRIEDLEMVSVRFVKVNRAGVYEPQIDVAKPAVLERLVGVLDGQCQEIGWVANVQTCRILRIEKHHINGDLLGFQHFALGIGKGSDRRFWRRRARPHGFAWAGSPRGRCVVRR